MEVVQNIANKPASHIHVLQKCSVIQAIIRYFETFVAF